MPESTSFYQNAGSGQDRNTLRLVVDNKQKGSGSSPNGSSIWTHAIIKNILSRKSGVENQHGAQTIDIAHNKQMDTPTRHELDARLETIEARMDARVASMSAKLDIALAEMRADREVSNIRIASVAESIDEVKVSLGDYKEQIKSVKGSVWGAAVATISIVAAIVAFGISAFDSGRETSKNIAEATAQMKQLQAQLEAQAKATIQPPPASNQPSPAAIQAPAPSQQ